MATKVEYNVASPSSAVTNLLKIDRELNPGFVAAVSSDPQLVTSLPGLPAWADTPQVRIYGDWQPDEIRRVRHPRGRLLIVGHCLAGTEQITRLLTTAMDTSSFEHLTTLPGAYTCLVIRPDELVAITDVAGQFPIYYSCRNQETLVGMHPGVLAARHSRTPDPITAAARIACPNVLPLWSGRTPYQDIHEVGGSSILYVQGRHLRVRRDFLIPVKRTSRQSGAESLRVALVQAVLGRSALGPISSDFSGGLDSTSLALLAAQCSADPIHAVTYHNPLAPAADMADAFRCARLDSRIVLSAVSGTEETLPYRAITTSATNIQIPTGVKTTLISEPAPAILAWRRSALRLTEVTAQKTRVHLTGEGGDAVLGAAPVYLADLARHRLAAQLVRHCAAQARLRRTSPADLISRALHTAATRPAAALGKLAKLLQRPTAGNLGWPDAISWWPTSGEAVRWLTGPMRTNMAAIAADPRTSQTIPDHAGAADVMTLTEIRHAADAQRYLRELGHQFGVAVHAPFLDNAVVRACLQVAPGQRADPWTCKPLLGAALVGLIPAQVFDRRTKGDYIAEEYLGARGAMPKLRGLLQDSRLADLGVIEPTMVHETLDRLFTGVAVPLGELNRLLATELWLRDLERIDTRGGI